MRILIAYTSAGAGHRKVAEAIFKRLQLAIQGKADIRLIDALDYTNPFFKTAYSKGYILLISYLPFIWGLIYRITSNPKLKAPLSFLRYTINRSNTKRFEKFLIKQQPDAILSTHFLVNEVVSYLKQKGALDTFLISVITDFFVHPFWLSDKVDAFVVATQKTKGQMLSWGVDRARIEVLGIPVAPEFTEHPNRGSLSRKLGLRGDTFSVLIVSGTFCLGPIRKIIDSVKGEAQLLVVCGRNHRLYRWLKKNPGESKGFPIKVYGLVDNMDELMAASDLIITKPGGSTIAESLACQLPMLFFLPVPGQEAQNAEVLIDYGVAIKLSRPEGAGGIVRGLEGSQRLMEMKENIREISVPEATGNLIHLIKKLGSCPYLKIR